MKHKHIAFGQYAQVHTGTDNTAKARSVAAIVLFQKNDRGGYAFMSLDTGNILHSSIWTQLPITTDIIQKVETVVKDMVNVDVLLKSIDNHLDNEAIRHVRKEDIIDGNQSQEGNSPTHQEQNSTTDVQQDEVIKQEESQSIFQQETVTEATQQQENVDNIDAIQQEMVNFDDVSAIQEQRQQFENKPEPIILERNIVEHTQTEHVLSDNININEEQEKEMMDFLQAQNMANERNVPEILIEDCKALEASYSIKEQNHNKTYNDV